MTEPDLEVAGTTTVLPPEVVPVRLTPVYRDRKDPSRFFLPIGISEPGEVGAVSLLWISEQIAGKGVVLFQRPLRPPPGPWMLLRMAAGQDPEAIPAAKVTPRLADACAHALHRAAQALTDGDGVAAERWAWQAVRAAEDSNPLPLMVLAALLRARGAQQETTLLEQDLAARSTEPQRQRAREPLAHCPALLPLWALLSSHRLTRAEAHRLGVHRWHRELHLGWWAVARQYGALALELGERGLIERHP